MKIFNLNPKKFWTPKIFTPKKFWPQTNVDPQKILPPKNFDPQLQVWVLDLDWSLTTPSLSFGLRLEFDNIFWSKNFLNQPHFFIAKLRPSPSSAKLAWLSIIAKLSPSPSLAGLAWSYSQFLRSIACCTCSIACCTCSIACCTRSIACCTCSIACCTCSIACCTCSIACCTSGKVYFSAV